MMSVGTDSQSNSQYLSSSASSIHRAKKSSSEISKTYKHASQLYLTRRLVECYESLLPVIRPPIPTDEGSGNQSQSEDDRTPRAPITTATTSQRIKIWSLYATLLNAIVELGDEEGKKEFGAKLYREIVRNVQSGEVWEQVVRDGYTGREASVDAEVVYNLSTLLLGNAPNQSVNQSRLETYLSTSPHGSLDLSTAFQNGSRHQTNGTDTPKDLNSRIKILELFTLHVLPRNNEWDYARSFIANSDILDEERREAFLQTLTELQEAKEQEEAEQDLVGFEDAVEDVYEEPEEDIPVDEDGSTFNNTNRVNGYSSPERNGSLHRRTSSEVDYGIEDDAHRNPGIYSPQPSTPFTTAPSSKTQLRSASPRPLASPPPPPTPQSSLLPSQQQQQQPALYQPPTRSTHFSPPAQTPRRQPGRKVSKAVPSSSSSSRGVIYQARKLFVLLQSITSSMTYSMTKNPTAMFRTLLFVFAFLMMLSRREIRDRLRRLMNTSWEKVKATAGMGLKVSYI